MDLVEKCEGLLEIVFKIIGWLFELMHWRWRFNWLYALCWFFFAVNKKLVHFYFDAVSIDFAEVVCLGM